MDQEPRWTRLAWAVVGWWLLAGPMPATAGVVIYEEGSKKIEIGGRVQVQYTQSDVDGEETIDDLFFRRLRFYLAGTISENWGAKIQLEFGKSFDDDEVAVKEKSR